MTTLTATATATVNIAVEFFLNDATSVESVTTSPYSVQWNSATVADGTVSLTRATDVDGNVSTSPPCRSCVERGGDGDDADGTEDAGLHEMPRVPSATRCPVRRTCGRTVFASLVSVAAKAGGAAREGGRLGQQLRGAETEARRAFRARAARRTPSTRRPSTRSSPGSTAARTTDPPRRGARSFLDRVPRRIFRPVAAP
jgi:hypothetical protein